MATSKDYLMKTIEIVNVNFIYELSRLQFAI